MTEATGIDLSLIKTRILKTLGIPTDGPWYSAFSGGIDSTVLLHLLREITSDSGVRLIALHADHGLNPDSVNWRDHCENQCREWDIECHSTKLTYVPKSRLGPEGRAREARYRWFAERMEGHGWLFTAHHLGDQAETVLERLIRGSGSRGLSGMLPATRLYGLNVVRPLLKTRRSEVESYAKHHNLTWIDDASNKDTHYTRNYLRNRVLPVLIDRWPEVQTTLARTADLMAETQRVLDKAAAEDLRRLDAQCARGDPSLDIPALKLLDPDRRRNFLRFWIHREYGVSLGVERVKRASEEVDRYPQETGGLSWPPVDLRPYHGRLYLLHRYETPTQPLRWNLENELRIGEKITLTPRRVVGQGLKEQVAKTGVTVQFRRGGETCRLPGRTHHHSVKHVLQEAGVPPWQRSRIPLILAGDEIAAIGGLIYCEPYIAAPNQCGFQIDVKY